MRLHSARDLALFWVTGSRAAADSCSFTRAAISREVSQMSDTTAVAEQPARFAEDEGEIIYAVGPPGTLVYLRVVERTDGWRAVASAELPDGTFAQSFDAARPAFPTRAEALTHAAEELVFWCGWTKERGSRKHRKQAEQVQEWALAISRESSIPASSESAPVPAI